MSLDVYLKIKDHQKKCHHCGSLYTPDGEYEYEANITHNLGSMADAAGIYKHLWRPEEIGITKADHLILPLQRGLSELKATPEKFKKLNPENGWGSYDGLVSFVELYLRACIEHPNADVIVSR